MRCRPCVKTEREQLAENWFRYAIKHVCSHLFGGCNWWDHWDRFLIEQGISPEAVESIRAQRDEEVNKP